MTPKTPKSGQRGFLRASFPRGVPRMWQPGSTPVNKQLGARGAGERRLPQIDNPVLIAAVGVGAMGLSAALRRLRLGGRGGRPDRFAQWVYKSLEKVSLGDAELDSIVRDMKVDVLEGFGKLPLVSVDLYVDDGSPLWTSPLGQDMLEVVSEHVWDNPEIAPVAVRGRLLSVVDGHQIADMEALGFDGEIARPADLYERFGPPASDPKWRS